MRIRGLKRHYIGNVSQIKDQAKKQEKEHLDQAKSQIRREEKVLYEKKLAGVNEAQSREMRLIQEELSRITEQAVALKERIDEYLSEREK